jgi:hypothetical protein
MLSTLRAAGLAALVACVPLGASAVTLNPANTLSSGGSYDIFDGPYFFDASFDRADGAGSYSFTFTNTTSDSLAMAVSIGTVLQSTLKFLGGVTVSWQSGESAFIPHNRPAHVFNLTTLIAAGASDVLTLQFGDTKGRRSGRANIDLSVDASVAGGPGPAPIPLPATGLLLVGALGGLTVLGRRKAS